ncbi:serine/threonine-protein kinase [Geodermatophilus sp. SYSU D00779]
MEIERQLIADALPAYDVGGVLGQGGFGVVLAGRHRQLDRRVAIKQLSRAVAADVAVRRRFAAEARVLASLDHPHVVPVYDFVEREDLCLLVMELLPGGTLRDRSTTTGFTAPHAVAVSLACAAGLNAAHERGVLHRDVKPENMLFAASGAIKVTDFGIAKVVGGTETLLTRAGEVVGTPAYMAPEQVRGGQLSPATDVYALATMTYELLSGVLPFTADGNAMSLLFKHVHEPPIPLREVAPGVPTPVAEVVMHGLTTDPAERFASAVSFGTALAEAGTEAWGWGWLSADGMPVVSGAERIVAPTRGSVIPSDRPAGTSGPRPPGDGGPAPTAAGPHRPGRTPARADPAAPARGAAEASGRGVPADGPAATRTPPPSSVPGAAGGETVAAAGSPAPDAEASGRPRLPRKRWVGVVIALAVALLLIAAVLLVPRLFTVYVAPVGGVVPVVLDLLGRAT